ncbi:MAG: sugar-binding domain-containing protein [Melioribacteraceae bacterium]
MSKRFYLDGKWKLKIGDKFSPSTPKEIIKKKWINAEVPGTVHTDLLRNKLIEEPFYSNNEIKLSWIAESDWIYKTVFDLPFMKNDTAVKLNFEGLDTIATIYLNGVHIGVTKNMFMKYEFDVAQYLKSKKNELEILFESPINYSLGEEIEHGKLQVALNSSRVYIRKAQYSFGWDWGPSFPTIGIWRNVYLEKEKQVSVKNVFFDTIEVKNNTAEVEIRFDVDGKNNEVLIAEINLSSKESRITKVVEVTAGINKLNIEIKNPQLWMPNDYGEQNLYDLEIKIKDKSNNVAESINKKVGIRIIELKIKDGEQNTFQFVVNGKKIFAKGVNWIPCDAFLPRVKEDKYRILLNYAKEANMNFVRVWGGGIYEDDIFYDLCDELGLLVWQDFMFACGAYPEHDEFIQNIREEISYNVERIQYHTSIAIWCGNNENEWIWYQEEKTSYKLMPGYKIYSDVIPTLLKEIDPLRPYWQSSPFGFDEDPNSQKSGNRHQWNIWSNWVDYNQVVNDNSLFVTEFGFQGPANKSTLEKFIPKKDRKIHGEIFEFHNKQVDGPERVIRFLSAHLPLSTNWDDYLYLAQLNQGFALKICLEHWRFNQPTTNGSIIWQINDTWPVTSWALIDSELKPKLSYYFVKNAFASQAIRIKKNIDIIEIEALNQTDKKFSGTIEFLAIESASGKALFKKNISADISGESISCLISINKQFDSCTIIIATLIDDKKNIISRNYYCSKEWKHLTLPKAKIKVSLVKKDNVQIAKITTDKTAFFVDLISTFATFSSRGMIILPGETVELKIISDKKRLLKKEEIEIYSLNQYLCD